MLAPDLLGIWIEHHSDKLRDMSKKKSEKEGPNPAGRAGAPVSLYPLSFDEAVSGLAQTKMPEPDKDSKKPPAKPAKGKG